MGAAVAADALPRSECALVLLAPAIVLTAGLAVGLLVV